MKDENLHNVFGVPHLECIDGPSNTITILMILSRCYLPPHKSTSPQATSFNVSVVLPSVAVTEDVRAALISGRVAIHRPLFAASGALETA